MFQKLEDRASELDLALLSNHISLLRDVTAKQVRRVIRMMHCNRNFND